MKTLLSAVVLAASVLAASVFAQEPPPPLPIEHFAGRRQALREMVAAQAAPGEAHLILVRGATTVDMAEFYQDHDFYYLTGVREPDVALWMTPAGAEELLVPPFSRFTQTWDGARLAPGEAAAKATGFDRVGNSRGIWRRLREFCGARAEASAAVVIWTFLEPQPNRTATPASASKAADAARRDRLDGRPTREEAMRDAIVAKFDGVEIRDLTPLVGALRAVKTSAEIRAIRAASEIAAHGIAEAMKSARPGVYEFQLAAAARYVFSRMGAGPDAYAAIVGSAANGCILHYSANTRRLEDGDLIVMDYGPTVHGYCTDVTRTFPANGVFTSEQRQLVSDVLEVQQTLIAAVRPGARISALTAQCGRLLRAKGYRVDHGPCHHVGLAVHDKQGDVLQPGMVLTVEPGAYLRDKAMGCRIEDVVLVTDDGHEVLSAHVPSSPDAIEALMRSAGVQQQRVGFER